METVLATPDSQTWLTLLVGAVVVVSIALLLPRPPKPDKKGRKGKPPVSRWRVFKVDPAVLHSSRSGAATVAGEQPEGCRFVSQPLARAGWRVEPTETDGEPAARGRKRRAIEIRKRGLMAPRWEARGAGEEWVTVRRRSRKKKRPEIRCRRAAKGLEIGGNLEERDYEIRREGRLLATVSSDTEAADGGTPYRLEVLRTEDARPVVALVLCLEAALPRSRTPALS